MNIIDYVLAQAERREMTDEEAASALARALEEEKRLPPRGNGKQGVSKKWKALDGNRSRKR